MSKENGDWPDFNKNRIGQLIVCEGGTCGNRDKGAHPIPFDQLKKTIKSNGMKKHFKLTSSKCLGVCKPHNVSVFLSDDEQIWFGQMKTDEPYVQLEQWISCSVDEGQMLPLPTTLEKYVFKRFKSN